MQSGFDSHVTHSAMQYCFMQSSQPCPSPVDVLQLRPVPAAPAVPLLPAMPPVPELPPVALPADPPLPALPLAPPLPALPLAPPLPALPLAPPLPALPLAPPLPALPLAPAAPPAAPACPPVPPAPALPPALDPACAPEPLDPDAAPEPPTEASSPPSPGEGTSVTDSAVAHATMNSIPPKPTAQRVRFDMCHLVDSWLQAAKKDRVPQTISHPPPTSQQQSGVAPCSGREIMAGIQRRIALARARGVAPAEVLLRRCLPVAPSPLDPPWGLR
jgi:homeobox protein ESX1